MTSNDAGSPHLSLYGLINALLAHRKLIIAFVLVLTAALVGWGLLRPTEYASSISFFPQTSDAPQGGAIALAQQFGINVGGGGGGHSPQFYADLLESREMMRRVLAADYSAALDIQGPASLYTLWDLEDEHRAVRHLRGLTAVRVSRETGVISVSVRTENPAIGEEILAKLLAELQTFNLETRQSQARAEARFADQRLEEAQEELIAAERDLQQFLRANRQFRNSPDLVFEHDRLQRQVMLRQELVTSLTQSFERARIDAVRDTPVITVLGSPEGSAAPVRRYLIVRGVVGILLGFGLGAMIAITLYYMRRIRAANGSEYEEFLALRRQAAGDLRRPGRLLRGRKRREQPLSRSADA
jgi:uncharacterized protein involved in exopolysaccharide biosynthesis